MTMDKARTAFLTPPEEFTPIPFWFWNDELREEELRRQIHDFCDKGVTGFVIHPRKGLPRSIPYLSDRYMHFVRFAVEEAAALGMRVVLYDEAMYPSGSAHGMVVAQNPEWASRCLTMEIVKGDVVAAAEIAAVCAARIEGGEAKDVTLLAAEDGVYRCPADGRQLLVFREGYSGGTIRGVHEGEDDGEPDAPPSADLLNAEAMQAFIRITYDRYYDVLREHFGKTVIAFFTDEPDVTGRNAARGCIAWTEGFLEEFGSAEELPALFMKAGEGTEEIRRRYRQKVNARLIRTYYQPLADWCGAHGIALTGHPAKSWDIGLLAPFQIPGQDVVWRFIGPGSGITGDDSVLGKCAADAARHHLRRRNANECFGCCGPEGVQWAFSMDDMKWYMDYLFVRGVNLLYPHAFFYSLRDGRGGERPPDVGLNNLWWPHYRRISTYMKRMSWLMTDSVNQARVAVLCEEDRIPWRECIPLWENQIEFNYLERSLMGQMTLTEDAALIGQQRYTHIIGGMPEAGRLPRDLVITPAAPQLRVSHVQKDGLDFYLLVNEGEEEIRGLMAVEANGQAEWWNAWTGAIAAAYPEEDGRFSLCLGRRESLILCIDPAQPAEKRVPAVPQEYTLPEALAGLAWRITREDGQSVTLVSDAEGCLPGAETVWPGYSGWATYEAGVDFPEDGVLSLGRAAAMVHFAQGGERQEKWWAPYDFAVRKGSGTIRIDVCGTLANRLEGRNLPWGVMGPVTLKMRR